MVKEVTNCFLVKRKGGEVQEICLAMKKRGMGVGLWNGSGGKLNIGETAEMAAARELEEELGVKPADLCDMGRCRFCFTNGLEVFVHLYLSENWTGEPSESEEMAPRWFNMEEIPYSEMWQTDVHWLPRILKGERIEGVFYFKEDEKSVDRFDIKTI